MSVLDQVMDLKNRGISESEIIGSLKEQGISPKAINDALGQAQIKNAVSAETNYTGNPENLEPSIMMPERADELPTQGTEYDIEDLQPPTPSQYVGQGMRQGITTKEIPEQEYIPRSPAYAQAQYNPYQYGNQTEGYAPEGSEYQATGSDFNSADSMIEIAEQVFSEKVKSMQKDLDGFDEFKTITEAKVENVSERLKRIESAIDRLQSAILDRIGSYGSGLDSVKKEMAMMQDSFGKVVNTLADRREHHVTHTQHHHTQNTPTQTPTVQRIEKRTTVVHKSTKPKIVTKQKKTTKKK